MKSLLKFLVRKVVANWKLAAFSLSIALAIEILVFLPRGPTPGDFLYGLSEHDANRVWNSLSVELQQSLTNSGQGFEAIREAVESEETSFEINYIGEYKLPDSTAMYFYVVNRQGKYLFYVLTTNAEGRITKVE